MKIETFQLIQDYVLRASKRPEVDQLVTGSRTEIDQKVTWNGILASIRKVKKPKRFPIGSNNKGAKDDVNKNET